MSFPWSTAQSNAVARLALVNGNKYDPTTNPNGLRDGGHVVNFANDVVDIATAAGAVSDAANFAGTQATNAGNSATDALNYAARMSGTSTTNLAFGTGLKSLTTQASKFFETGRALRLVSSSGYMVGKSAGYSGTALSFNATMSVGSGTASDWTIYVEGEMGSAGTVAIAATNTISSHLPATITNSGTASAASFTFNIPKGQPSGLPYLWSTDTAATDPTAGKIKTSSASITTATSVYISETDRQSVPQSAAIASWDDSTNPVRGQLRVEDITNSANYALFNITGDLVDNGAWNTLPVAFVDKGGTLVDGVPVRLEFRSTGNKGLDGNPGTPGVAATLAIGTVTTGSPGSNALVTNSGTANAAVWNLTVPRGDVGPVGPVVAIRYLFSTVTTDADPGNGTLRFNNSAATATTQLFVDNVEAIGGVSVAALLDTFDDSTTTTARGILSLVDVNDTTKFVHFQVTGSVTDNTGYRKVTVSYLAGSGVFTNGAALGLAFYRTGDKGTDGAGAGDVKGPATATDGNFVVFDGTTGKQVRNGGVPGSLATRNSINNGDWSGAALGVANGGTGATTVSGAQSNLSLVPGTNIQAYSATLASLAGLAGVADRGTYFTAANTLALYTLTAFARSILDDADAGTVQATLQLVPGTNVQAFNANLAALAGLTGAANKLPYFTAAGTMALADLTAFARSILDDADAATVRATLGLAIGTNVQAWDADLDAIAALTTTSFGRSFLALADAAAGRTTLGLAAIAASGSAADLSAGTLPAGRFPALTGAITTVAGALATTLASNIVTFANINSAAIGTAAEIEAGTASKLVAAAPLRAAQAFAALTDAATIAINANAGFNWRVTLGGNRTLDTPTNLFEGWSGVILPKQDATGSRTLSYSSAWDFGAAGAPTLSTAAGKEDAISFICVDAATPKIRAFFSKAA